MRRDKCSGKGRSRVLWAGQVLWSDGTGTLDHVVDAAKKKLGGPAVIGGKDQGGIDCFALVDSILKSKSVDAKTAADFGTVTPDADYVWGDAVDLSGVKVGDTQAAVIEYK